MKAVKLLTLNLSTTWNIKDTIHVHYSLQQQQNPASL